MPVMAGTPSRAITFGRRHAGAGTAARVVVFCARRAQYRSPAFSIVPAHEGNLETLRPPPCWCGLLLCPCRPEAALART